MSHKTIAIVAVFMCVVFGTIVVVYPTLFKSDNKVTAPEPQLPIKNK